MARRKKPICESKKRGKCAKRQLIVSFNQLCDLYERKRAGRFKNRCRNCVHFSKCNDSIGLEPKHL